MIRALVFLGLVYFQATAFAEQIPRPAPVLVKAMARMGLASDLVLVQGKEAGLLDRSGAPSLHVPADALALARTDAERTALMAVILSYKIGAPPAPGPNKAASLLADLAGGSIDEIIAERDRKNPYLELPTTPRRWAKAKEPERKMPDRAGMRALAWAKAEGVCEATTVALLNRLIAMRADHPAISWDAQSVRDSLGMLLFSPDMDCRG